MKCEVISCIKKDGHLYKPGDPIELEPELARKYIAKGIVARRGVPKSQGATESSDKPPESSDPEGKESKKTESKDK